MGEPSPQLEGQFDRGENNDDHEPDHLDDLSAGTSQGSPLSDDHDTRTPHTGFARSSRAHRRMRHDPHGDLDGVRGRRTGVPGGDRPGPTAPTVPWPAPGCSSSTPTVERWRRCARTSKAGSSSGSWPATAPSFAARGAASRHRPAHRLRRGWRPAAGPPRRLRHRHSLIEMKSAAAEPVGAAVRTRRVEAHRGGSCETNRDGDTGGRVVRSRMWR